MSGNLQADPYHRGSVLSRTFLPLALITLGVVFLLSNLIPERGRGGLVVFGAASFGALASLSWIVAYWPAVLVLLGVWLLFRDHLPIAARRPIATLGGLALLAYGILAAAASMATAGTQGRTGFANF